MNFFSQNIKVRSLLIFLLTIYSHYNFAENASFSVSTNLYEQSNTVNLGLSIADGTETVTIFKPSETTDHFSNGVVMASFKNALYCMWQSSISDEDAAETWVAYSRSLDEGKTWCAPMVLAESISDGYCSSGGWLATEDSLIGYINTWPSGLSPKGGSTRYVASADGLTWTKPADVLMNDGSTLTGIFEQDPHVLPNGRIVNAAHFQPGLNVAPIYTDDASGVRGWIKANYTNLSTGNSSREMEPSLFMQADSTLVMIFRDQNSTFYKLAASSTDFGKNWSKAVLTNMPDSRSKQSAGNLPDGTAYFSSNPVVTKTRIPLVLTLSKDGEYFDKAFVLREGGDDLQAQSYSGKSKSLGYSYPKSMVYNEHLYISYATNKEDVEYTRVPLSSISQNADKLQTKEENRLQIFVNADNMLYINTGHAGKAEVRVLNLSGQILFGQQTDNGIIEQDMSGYPTGIYIVTITTDTALESTLIQLKH